MAQELTTVEPETEIIEAYHIDDCRSDPVTTGRCFQPTCWHRDLKNLF